MNSVLRVIKHSINFPSYSKFVVSSKSLVPSQTPREAFHQGHPLAPSPSSPAVHVTQSEVPLLPGIPTLSSLTENRPTGLPGPPAGRTSLPNPPQHPKRATRRPSPLVTRAGLHHSRTKVRPQNGNELTGGRENRKGRGCESSPEPGSRVTALPAFPQYGTRKSRRAWHRGGARMLAVGSAPKLGQDSAPNR